MQSHLCVLCERALTLHIAMSRYEKRLQDWRAAGGYSAQNVTAVCSAVVALPAQPSTSCLVSFLQKGKQRKHPKAPKKSEGSNSFMSWKPHNCLINVGFLCEKPLLRGAPRVRFMASCPRSAALFPEQTRYDVPGVSVPGQQRRHAHAADLRRLPVPGEGDPVSVLSFG